MVRLIILLRDSVSKRNESVFALLKATACHECKELLGLLCPWGGLIQKLALIQNHGDNKSLKTLTFVCGGQCCSERWYLEISFVV